MGWLILNCDRLSFVHCWMFSSIPLVGNSTTPLSCDNQKYLHTLLSVLLTRGGGWRGVGQQHNHPWWRTTTVNCMWCLPQLQALWYREGAINPTERGVPAQTTDCSPVVITLVFSSALHPCVSLLSSGLPKIRGSLGSLKRLKLLGPVLYLLVTWYVLSLS